MKSWLDIYKPGNYAVERLYRNEILQSNQQSRQYGLELTPLQAMELLQTRRRALKSQGRLELGIEVIKKMIAAFCSSPYIHPHEYAGTLGELVEIFYYMKNETRERLGDDELITVMRELFDSQSRGSLELLRDRDLDRYARELRDRQ
ncbi:MAG TPA: hypothetical protein DER60_10850 [Syntrophomonas sp.]|jgi:hypothetical protein|nr:hypothetical protein [Syntrophomonas sp.]